jgi:putative transcriptional regulator
VSVVLRTRLKRILEQRGLSIRGFARMIDYRYESVRQFVNNESVQIPVELVERICEALSIDVSDLFYLERKEKTETAR